MFTTCCAVAAFPQASVAVKVIVTSQAPSQAPATESTSVVITTSLQASKASASSLGKSAPHAIVVSAGTKEKSGAVWSTTVIVWVALALLLQSSVAVNVRVITHAPSQSPATESTVRFTVVFSEHASVAVGISVGRASLQSSWTSAGTPTIMGATVSIMNATWTESVTFPQASVARQLRYSV